MIAYLGLLLRANKIISSNNDYMKDENFEIAIQAEYRGGMMQEVEKLLSDKLPDYVNDKVLIIRMIDLQ